MPGRWLAAATLLLLLSNVPADAGPDVRLGELDLYDLQVVGVELPRATEVEISAIGMWEPRDEPWFARWWHGRDDPPMTVTAWLLDARTRRPVWELDVDDSARESGRLRSADTTLELDAGRYELYLFSGYDDVARRIERGDPGGDDDRWWKRMFSDRRSVDDLRDELGRCGVTLSAAGVRTFDVEPGLPESLVSLSGVGDSRLVSRGFELTQPSELRVYTLFEMSHDATEAADYGWIVDADTRELVWHPRDARSHRGGGGDKNRAIDSRIALPAGRYVVYYGTDDSHSTDGFNVTAPYDPLNWGLTLLAGDGFDPSAFSVFEAVRPDPAIDLTRIGDDALVEQAFRLDRTGKLAVYALGEYADEQFVDRAWIVDGATNEIVWEMTGNNTEGAGGGEKNRKFDGLVELPRGSYVLYYASDGSHAYGDWNAAAPFDPEAWGVRISPGPELDASALALLSIDELDRNSGYMVHIANVGDDQRIRRAFRLADPMTVEIRAVGEGSDGSMYDYGLLRNEQGEIVWRMDYADTRHAGGADKNRMEVSELRLEPGEYEALYVSDGSHSFRSWNAERPDDPMSWGLSIRPIE